MSIRPSIITVLLVLALCLALLATGFHFMYFTHVTKQVSRSNEKEVKVNLNAGLGTIYLSKGNSSQIVNVNADVESINDLGDCVTYSSKDDVGFLDINTSCDVERKHHTSGVHIGNLESSTWRFEFSDAVPMSFDIELGVGKADLDMTDIVLKDLSISTGASSVKFHIDRPNKKSIQNLNIEAGLSKFHAEGLCNANFRHLKFSGGVGTYSLDFGGNLNREVDVDIELGLGSLTISIPEDIGTKVTYEKNWLSHFDVDKAEFSEREDNVYYSQNYRGASGRINMHIEAGLGTVKIRRE